MNIPSPRSKRRARIEIIPLIDIVFFLLATFVMVSLSMVRNQGIDVHLPAASTGTQQVKDNDYTAVTVTDQGEIYFNKKKVKMPDLPKLFADLKLKQKDPTIVLNGDEKALFGKAIQVLDEARRQGIKKVAVMTKKDSQE